MPQSVRNRAGEMPTGDRKGAHRWQEGRESCPPSQQAVQAKVVPTLLLT